MGDQGDRLRRIDQAATRDGLLGIHGRMRGWLVLREERTLSGGRQLFLPSVRTPRRPGNRFDVPSMTYRPNEPRVSSDAPEWRWS